MRWKTAEEEARSKGNYVEFHPSQGTENLAPRDGDIKSGMELLELDFLLRVIESTDGNDQNDVTMRRLSFDEVLRRTKQNDIASGALKVYALNTGNLYGKTIQCEAMKELTRRTTQHPAQNG